MRVDEERQHEDLGVPEDVQEVGHAAEAAGADRDRVLGRVGGADHVVDAEAQRELVVGVAVDDEVGVVPARVPRRAVAAQQLVVAELLGALRGRAARPPPTAPVRAETIAAKPVDGRRLAGLEAAADHVARLLDVRAIGRARRRTGRHGEHVAAAVAAARARDQSRAVVEHSRTRSPGRAAGVRSRRQRSQTSDARRSPRESPRRAAAMSGRSSSEAKRAVRTRNAAAAAQPLPPVAVDDAVAHVEHALVLEDLAVGEVEGAAASLQAQAGPVGRRHRLAEGRIAGAVAEDAGDEGGRRRDGRALLERAARAGLAVGDREPASRPRARGRGRSRRPRTARPGRSPARGSSAARRSRALGQLVVEDARKPSGPPPTCSTRARHAVRLHADADEDRAAQLGDERAESLPSPSPIGPELVAQHEQVLRPAAAARRPALA